MRLSDCVLPEPPRYIYNDGFWYCTRCERLAPWDTYPEDDCKFCYGKKLKEIKMEKGEIEVLWGKFEAFLKNKRAYESYMDNLNWIHKDIDVKYWATPEDWITPMFSSRDPKVTTPASNKCDNTWAYWSKMREAWRHRMRGNEAIPKSFMEFLKQHKAYEAYMENVKPENQRWVMPEDYLYTEDIQTIYVPCNWLSGSFSFDRSIKGKDYWEYLDKLWNEVPTPVTWESVRYKAQVTINMNVYPDSSNLEEARKEVSDLLDDINLEDISNSTAHMHVALEEIEE